MIKENENSTGKEHERIDSLSAKIRELENQIEGYTEKIRDLEKRIELTTELLCN